MATATLEYLYDVACPFAYLASAQVEVAAARAGAELIWTPVLLGGLYRGAASPQGPARSATAVMPRKKVELLSVDLRLQAAHARVPLRGNKRHPLRTLAVQRLLTATPAERRHAVTHALFKAYWVEGRDLADAAEVEALCREHGVPRERLDEPAVKRQLEENTARLVGLGAFGVPCFVVGNELWWGQDKLWLAERAAGNADATPRRVPRSLLPPPSSAPHTLEFFHDFASPFSYLASLAVADVARRAGARLELKPMVLGAVFKAVGTPTVPLHALTPPKARAAMLDLTRQAQASGASLVLPTEHLAFPMNTLLALRVALLDEAATGPIYDAAWVRGEDVADPGVLAVALRRAGLDGGALVERAQSDPGAKTALRANTEAALRRGIVGAPSFVVSAPDGSTVATLWGNDRLNVVADLLAGWRPDPAYPVPRL